MKPNHNDNISSYKIISWCGLLLARASLKMWSVSSPIKTFTECWNGCKWYKPMRCDCSRMKTQAFDMASLTCSLKKKENDTSSCLVQRVNQWMISVFLPKRRPDQYDPPQNKSLLIHAILTSPESMAAAKTRKRAVIFNLQVHTLLIS